MTVTFMRKDGYTIEADERSIPSIELLEAHDDYERVEKAPAKKSSPSAGRTRARKAE